MYYLWPSLKILEPLKVAIRGLNEETYDKLQLSTVLSYEVNEWTEQINGI